MGRKPANKYALLGNEAKRRVLDEVDGALEELCGETEGLPCAFNDDMPCVHHQPKITGPAVAAIKLRLDLVERKAMLEDAVGQSSLAERLQDAERQIEALEDDLGAARRTIAELEASLIKATR